MDKYEKLTSALLDASNKAIEAAAEVTDGGTCNMDGVYLRLPRYNEDKTITAIKNAGLSGFKINHSWYGTGFLISPSTSGQANKRDVAASTMYKFLKDVGYDLSHWQQID